MFVCVRIVIDGGKRGGRFKDPKNYISHGIISRDLETGNRTSTFEEEEPRKAYDDEICTVTFLHQTTKVTRRDLGEERMNRGGDRPKNLHPKHARGKENRGDFFFSYFLGASFLDGPWFLPSTFIAKRVRHSRHPLAVVSDACAGNSAA